MSRITIFPGSILEAGTDALVNPANGHLRHSGGLARIIDRAARGEIPSPGRPERPYSEVVGQWEADHANAPLIATGNVHVTSPGCLPFRIVVHAVGPIWNGGDFHESDLLGEAHVRAIDAAREAGCRSIAFPAVSCGVFGFPIEYAAPVAVAAARWAQDDDMDVTFTLMEADHVEAFSRAITAQVPA